MNPSEAKQFRIDALNELDKNLLLDEHDAKVAMLAAMVMGENILLYGPPGGGKTTLGRDSYRLIDGIDASDVVTIPIQSDLPPQQLIGGTVESSKETTFDGETAVETIRTKIDPIIGENTKVIFANEINRISTTALNAGLEALESRVIDTSAGLVALNGLEYVVSTMNPSERRAGTFDMTAATASRHAIGAHLGNDIGVENIMAINDGNWVPKAKNISTVIDLDGLHRLRQDIPKLHIPDDLQGTAHKLVNATVEGLAGKGIEEAKPRIAKQIGKTAKTLALLGSQEYVSRDNLEMATKFTLAARFGALLRDQASTTVEAVLLEAIDKSKQG